MFANLAFREVPVNSVLRISAFRVLLSNRLMDIDQIRRDNICRLEKAFGGGAALAKMVKMSDAQYYNLRNGAKDSKTGKPRGMRRSTAHRFEVACAKPPGWMDADHSRDSQNDMLGNVVDIRPNQEAEVLNDDELLLVNGFRVARTTSKKLMIDLAREAIDSAADFRLGTARMPRAGAGETG
jgi:hypothetical protein